MGILDGILNGVANTTKQVVQAAGKTSSSASLPLPPLPSGGSGGGSVDHYFDVSPVDQFNMDLSQRKQNWQESMDTWNKDFQTTQFKWQQAQDEAQKALAVGDFNLAVQKQNDANYWAGINAGLEQQRINLQNQGQQLDYEVGMANVAQQQADSVNRYNVGMAGAKNDEERNRITAAWNAEQAAIAKMEDETRRALGTQSNQTNQFGAETDRAARMGTLALENNKFIADMARNPRDMFGLFMMQRGITPDWGAIQQGNITQGAPLTVQDVMKAYVPTTAAPTFNGQPVANAAAAGVGTATQYRPAVNDFINIPAATGGAAGGGAGGARSFVPMGSVPTGGPAQLDPRALMPLLDTNPAGQLGGGVPVGNLTPGLNKSTVGGETRGSDFTMPAYYDIAKTRPIQPGDVLPGGTTVYVDYQPERKAFGDHFGRGFTTARSIMAGDAPKKNPEAGGARPEGIINWTGAPLTIIPNRKTQAEIQRDPHRAAQQAARLNEFAAPEMRANPRTHGGWTAPDWFNPNPGMAMMAPVDTLNQMSMQAPVLTLANQPIRFALGTSAQDAYNNLGMASLWMPTSGNGHLAGMDLPDWLKRLSDFGAPISPGLAASATGNIAPTLNGGAAVAARGLGTPASLQTLARQTKDETEQYRGYIEGPGGVSWSSFLDFISKPTANLQAAMRSRIN